MTTGYLPDGKNAYPADLLIQNKKFVQKENILFGELLVGMKESLLGSYFTGTVKSKRDEKK